MYLDFQTLLMSNEYLGTAHNGLTVGNSLNHTEIPKKQSLKILLISFPPLTDLVTKATICYTFQLSVKAATAATLQQFHLRQNASKEASIPHLIRKN